MKTNHRWLYIYAMIVMLVTTIPYIVGYSVVQFNPSYRHEWTFTGFVIGVEDGNSYIAKELSGAAGRWLFKTPYSPVPQSGVLAFLPFLLLGKLASPPGIHEQLVALFHLFRLVAGFMAIVATYGFLAIFIIESKWLNLGTILATIGGGLGWVWVLSGHETIFGSIPLDFYSPETFGFLELYSLPHLSLARAFLLWGLGIFCIRIKNGAFPFKDAMWMGACWLVVAIAQPITGIIFGFVLGLFLCLWGLKNWVDGRIGCNADWHPWRIGFSRTIFAGMVPAPLLVYTFFKFITDPYLSTWSNQNLITSPSFWHYLSAYGLLLPFAFLGIKWLYRQSQEMAIFLGGWFISFPILAYIPVGVQRRLLEGVWVVMVVLAMFGFMCLNNKISGKWMKIFIPGITGFSIISTVLLIFTGLLAVSKPQMPVFRPTEEINAFEFVGKTSTPYAVVLSSYETGNALPAWAPVRVVIGHGPESANLAVYRNKVVDFYNRSDSDQAKLEFLRSNQVKYVFWGPEERDLGNWNPAFAPYLEPIYQSKDYEVFEITLAP